MSHNVTWRVLYELNEEAKLGMDREIEAALRTSLCARGTRSVNKTASNPAAMLETVAGNEWSPRADGSAKVRGRPPRRPPDARPPGAG